MSMCLCLSLDVPKPMSGNGLTRTGKCLLGLALNEIVEDWAEDAGFRSAEDWLLCRLYPEFRGPCLRFYGGKGPNLRRQVSKSRLRELDVMMCRCLRAGLGVALRRA